MTRKIGVPDATEYAPAFARYVARAAATADPVTELATQQALVVARLSPLAEEGGGYRYAPDKWSIKELVNHLSDAERVFGYRLLRIGRGDPTPLPGFDENDYARAAGSDRRPFADVLHEWSAIRDATVALVKSLPEASWTNLGTTNDATISARALLYIILGHTAHHMAVLADRYGVR